MTHSTSPRKVLIVTGASSGIGRAVALEAAREGFDLVISARRADRLEQLAQEITVGGTAVEIVVGNITDPQVPERLVERAMQRFGRIDVLLNNAGAGESGSLLELTDERINYQWQMHVLAPLRTARAALTYLRITRGQILFVGSGVARLPIPGSGAYSLAKAAIRAVAIQLRKELRSEHITVTYVDPGLVATEFSRVSGMRGKTEPYAVDAGIVARRIVRAMRTRPDRLNAVPFHTLAATLGEWFPRLSERVTRNMTAHRRPPEKPETPAVPIPRQETAGVPALEKTTVVDEPTNQEILKQTPADGEDALAKALAPVKNRMERVKMPESFVRDLLKPGAEILLQEAAMRWAGMPNKNERAATLEVLQALTVAGFLKATREDSWVVVHTP